jgi:uncharacterized lipoprotein YehR (DUF1307 family)
MNKQAMLSVVMALLVVASLSGCGKAANSSSVAGSNQRASSMTSHSSEKAVAPEKNPPGDIPDTQAFVKYTSSNGGYELQVPEGWARTTNASSAKFVDKFDGVRVDFSNVTYALSADAINQNVIPDLVKNGRAVTVTSVKYIKLKGGSAVEVSFTSNSEPDAVTNKQVRLENKSYYFMNNGKMAAMTVWAPQGADNVDQWNFISNSFKWE